MESAKRLGDLETLLSHVRMSNVIDSIIENLADLGDVEPTDDDVERGAWFERVIAEVINYLDGEFGIEIGPDLAWLKVAL